jgi:CDP-2,3-bis-(O-geranylgeranyl)-sn-glycerol synthase
MDDLFSALWFFAPVGIANAAPVFAAKIPGLTGWNAPMDFGKKYKGHRVFGDHKTWRGLLSGIVFATLVIALQKYIYANNSSVVELSWIDYSQAKIWLLGPLFGAGALLADAGESFFKRQVGVSPGESWFPFDQIDYILGGYLPATLIVGFNLSHFLWVLATWFCMHLAASYTGYLVGLKSKPI